MEFDIIDMTDEEIMKLSTIQMQLLRSAQKTKNEMRRNLELDMAMFDKLLLNNDVRNSTLSEQKRAELEENYEYELAILVEQLKYSMIRNEPIPDEDESGDPNVGYIVDYSLGFVDRYRIVRNYYMAIPDPDERVALYAADETAKKYLDSYYIPLYDVLLTYCK